MKIFTKNEQGQRVCVEYEQHVIDEPEIKPEITITTYEEFKECIQKAQEQWQFVGGGDKRFEKALGTLNRTDHERYMEYTEKIRQELSNRK